MANIIKTPNNKKSKRKPDSRFRHIAIVVTILLLVGLAVWLLISFINSDELDSVDERAVEERVQALQSSAEAASDVYDEAESLVESGDSAAVGDHYDKEIDKVETDIEKAQLYFNKALSLARVEDREGSLEAAIQADRFDGDKQLVSRTESLIANTAYDLERWELALEYYERQYDRLKKEPADMGDPLPGLEEVINELKGRLSDG